ncbi:MAG: hypothetical protein LBC56_00595 [Oscillospiraceae bacterium]|jgi:hypothetical protein|nr:hypothetical protein [Oscillospiraceae bacterium]
MRPKPAGKSFQTTFGERASYAVYGVGLNIFFVLTQFFLQRYYLINAAVPASINAKGKIAL